MSETYIYLTAVWNVAGSWRLQDSITYLNIVLIIIHLDRTPSGSTSIMFSLTTVLIVCPVTFGFMMVSVFYPFEKKDNRSC